MSIKPEQFKPGDLVIRISEWASPEEPFEKTALQALERTFKEDLQHPEYEPEPNYEFSLYRVKEIKQKKIFVLHPITGEEDVEQSYIRYLTGDVIRFDKERFNLYVAEKPPKFKVGDKIVNPYVNWTADQIKNYTYPDEYNIEGYINRFIEKGDDSARHYKSVPFLEVVSYTVKVNFNIKYKKFLGFIEYEYLCKQPADSNEVEITFRAAESQMSYYVPHTAIWNNICATSPSQET